MAIFNSYVKLPEGKLKVWTKLCEHFEKHCRYVVNRYVWCLGPRNPMVCRHFCKLHGVFQVSWQTRLYTHLHTCISICIYIYICIYVYIYICIYVYTYIYIYVYTYIYIYIHTYIYTYIYIYIYIYTYTKKYIHMYLGWWLDIFWSPQINMCARD